MPELSEQFLKHTTSFIEPFTNLKSKFNQSFIPFCEKMGTVFEIKDFLHTLQMQIPKKCKAGEIILFYESRQTGLRRAYIKAKKFYEQEAKNPWPKINSIQSSNKLHSLYLAQECGRPFFKGLLIPLYHTENQTTQKKQAALLFVEVSHQNQKAFTLLTDFFNSIDGILNSIFKRVLLNTSFSRISYLWSELFTHWREPLALLKKGEPIYLNQSFRQLLSICPDFFKNNKKSGLKEIEENTYQIHYYPIRYFSSKESIGILYCQNMTRYFYLKEQLLHSEKMSYVCQLGKNMSQHLKIPLHKIKRISQSLCKNPDLQCFKEDFIEVEKAIQRSQKIIESLLYFSKSLPPSLTSLDSSISLKKETTPIHAWQEFCDLNQVVENCLSMLKEITKDLALQLDLYPEPVEVKGDFYLLQQVAYNLILNACQALQEDKNNQNPSILISTQKIANKKVCLKIRDNGPGIAKQNLGKIFQNLWTSKKKGTGLGLGLSKRFVKEMGGDIFVSSKQHEFSCFNVLLPSSEY